MERKVVDFNPIVVFNRNVDARELNELLKEFSGDIVINGNLMLQGNINIQCQSLSVLESFEISGDATLEGDLYVKEYLVCENLVVKGSVHCDGFINANGDITIKEDFFINENILGDDLCCELWVGRDLICNGHIEEFREVRVFNRLQAVALSQCGTISFGIN